MLRWLPAVKHNLPTLSQSSPGEIRRRSWQAAAPLLDDGGRRISTCTAAVLRGEALSQTSYKTANVCIPSPVRIHQLVLVHTLDRMLRDVSSMGDNSGKRTSRYHHMPRPVFGAGDKGKSSRNERHIIRLPTFGLRPGL